MKRYEEIIKVIERRAKQGELTAGSKLPSIRALSQEFNCSRNTIIKAYQELESRHLIYTVPKSGYYLVGDYPLLHDDFNKGAMIDFFSAGPDRSGMPYQDFKHCLNQAIELYKEDMFMYSEVQGLHSLRDTLARHLRDLQVFVPPGRIFVVSGSQQALHLLVKLPFPNGKTNICVEQPTHNSFIESLKLEKATAYGIEVTSSGIDFDRLEHLFKQHEIKFFYITSRFHNPTGYSYSNSEKKRIVELAQKYDVYIVEDDYMGDLEFRLKQDPMFAHDPSGRVIYTKSFSKVLLPGLRLGLTVLPEAMKKHFSLAKYASDLHTPVLTQGALEIYLKSGMYDAHIKNMREIYKEKSAILQQACKDYLPSSVTYSRSLSGFYITIVLPASLKANQLINDLSRENVFVGNAENMFLPEFKKDHILRLSVSQVKKEKIPAGVQKIADGIRRLSCDTN
ncbi:PLP-dependent aminotransferase family protein [Mesobacillus foraminis]|uniref:aminotransferase-like domain-containing protein n=1 Tax=Mesobacillus foraminis TaxID=279826 RepID=UPI001BEA472F|nr:PLP-dependent aminotransferase family protein [Mesobacillus foraminis]MBT2757021.1 PLP-dependent aminotransferase family protein [Mesobacillus foraminis]